MFLLSVQQQCKHFAQLKLLKTGEVVSQRRKYLIEEHVNVTRSWAGGGGPCLTQSTAIMSNALL